MDMKWHPIIDGDLSEAPRDEDVLFTVIDEDKGGVYTAIGEASDYFIDECGYVFVGVTSYPVYTQEIKAWMELPPPFTPNDCIRCAHYRVWIDGFGDRWSKCELWNEPFAMDDCPLR